MEITLTQQRLDEIFVAHQNSNFDLLLELSQKLQQDFPNLALGYKAAGIALLAKNRKNEAILAMQNAVQLDPNDEESLFNLGKTLLEISTNESIKQAENIFLQIAKLNSTKNLAENIKKNLLEVLIQRAKFYQDARYFATANQFFAAILLIDPNLQNIRRNILINLQCYGEPEQSLQMMKQYFSDPEYYWDNLTSRMIYENYAANIDAKTFGETIQQYKNEVAKRFPQMTDFKANTKLREKLIQRTQKNKCLRIGFLVNWFIPTAVSYFFFNVLAECKKYETSVEFVLYYSKEARENLLQEYSANSIFRHIANISMFSDKEVVHKVIADNINILFDLTSHTTMARPCIFAFRAAPIQISWIAWLASTGIPNMDYFLADEFIVPQTENNYYEQQFSEQILHMPNIWVNYSPPKFLEKFYKPRELKNFHENSQIIFGNFNTVDKITPQTLHLWALALKAVPNSKLVYMRGELRDDLIKQRIKNFLISRGINAERINLIANKNSYEYFSAYQKIDFVLDAFPATGGTSSIEALIMGVPVLTLIGEKMPSRLSASCLKAVGLEEWICKNQREFIKKVKFFCDSKQSEYLNNLHNTLRQRTLESPLCNAKLFAKNFVAKMWQVWNNFLNS